MPNWIVDYVKTIDKVSESPRVYNIWSAISVVSSVLKKNIYIDYKTYRIYPNMYITLVGPPGVGKGAAIHPAHEFSKDAGLANYLSDRITAPRILELLNLGFTGALNILQNGQVLNGNKDATVTLMSTELPTLLTASDWMLQFLCDAWDRGSFDYDTRNKGTFTIKDMCVSIIGACVPEYIRKLNKDSNATVSSGFSSRTIFVNANRASKRVAWGEGFRNNPAYASAIADLETRIRDIAKLHGEVKLDFFALQLWESFYLALSVSDDDSDVFKNFRARQHVHVLKTAMVLAAAEASPGTTSLVITRVILDKAIALIEDIAAGVDEIFRGIGDADITPGLARIQIYLERKGQVLYNELLKDNVRHVDHDNIVKILKILELIGFAQCKDLGNGTYLYEHTGQLISNIKPSGKVVI